VAVGVLDRFERRLDRLVSGAFARAFKAEVQPVEIASALAKECDDKAAIVGRGRTMVPNDFRVELGASDFERLATYLAPLSTELADVVREHAGEQGYAFVGPVTVALEETDALETGVFRVVSDAVPGEMPVTPLLPHVRLEAGGKSFPLTSDQAVVGRGTEADVRIDDVGVSRRHAIIRLSPTPTVSDLGSTNGTIVDGIRVDEADLTDGSTVVVGSTTLVFRYGD
jgi:hypothetical protein